MKSVVQFFAGLTFMLTLAGCASEALYEGMAPIGRVVSASATTHVLRGDRLMGLGPKSELYPGDAIMTGADEMAGLAVIRLSDNTRLTLDQQTQLDLVELDPTAKTMRLVLTKGRVGINTGKTGRAREPGYTIVTRMGTVTAHQGELVVQYQQDADVLEVELVKGKPVVIDNIFGSSELSAPATRLSVRFGSAPGEPEVSTTVDA